MAGDKIIRIEFGSNNEQQRQQFLKIMFDITNQPTQFLNVTEKKVISIFEKVIKYFMKTFLCFVGVWFVCLCVCGLCGCICARQKLQTNSMTQQ